MLNHHVPHEYVTCQELLEGIALRYPVIYAPHIRAIGDDVIEVLIDYVRRGGRLIADVQFGFMDPWGKVRPTGRRGAVESLFGAWIDTIHDARTEPHAVNGIAIQGFFGDLKTTIARPLIRFDDGRCAVSEARIGRGSAVIIAFDAARQCFQPGASPAAEKLIADLTTADDPPRWRCNAPLAFRLSAPKSDHYFLINDGEAMSAVLDVYDRRYAAGGEVVEDAPIDLSGTIAVELPARSGKWLRFARK
jgi:beta-galactosidase